LRLADPPSKKSYRLYRTSKLKERPRPSKTAVEHKEEEEEEEEEV
jgi:hypothetical protein